MPPTYTCTLSLALRPELLVACMDVSRCILVLDTSIYAMDNLGVRYTGREEVHARTRPLSHASVATNCSVLNHLIGSIIGFTLLLGLEIENFKMWRLSCRREVLVTE